jgi:hypothetical protein
MHAIVAAMKDRGIDRLLFVSAVAEMPNKTFFGRLTAALLKLTPVGHAIRDHDRAFEELKRSGLRWMLAGGPYIKDGPRCSSYRTSLVYPGRIQDHSPTGYRRPCCPRTHRGEVHRERRRRLVLMFGTVDCQELFPAHRRRRRRMKIEVLGSVVMG